MLTLLELEPKQCRFPLTNSSPHYFCGEPTDGRSYCPTHDAKCHAGAGKPWQALAGMMEATEQSVVRMVPKDDLQPGVDDALLTADWIDRPGGLMARS